MARHGQSRTPLVAENLFLRKQLGFYQEHKLRTQPLTASTCDGKIGQLRQVSDPENGREYWMAFSNKGRHVMPGNHIDLMIGRVRMEGLLVEGTRPDDYQAH